MNNLCRNFRFARSVVCDLNVALQSAAIAKCPIKVHKTFQSGVKRLQYTVPCMQKSEALHIDSECCDTTVITGGNPELERKLKILTLEIDVLRQEGFHVPENVEVEEWKELLSKPTRTSRLKYLKYLWKVEMKKLGNLKKKQKRQEERLERLAQVEEDDNPHIQYGLGKNSIFLRVYDETIKQSYNTRLVTAMLYGQKLVMDCDYDSHMVKKEARNCAKQLLLAFSENRLHNDPFDLYLCNINRESVTMQDLQKFIPPLYEDHFPLNVTEKSYLDLFPKDKIVYLTPHCKEELIDYDHDAVYIVGAIVDKSSVGPVSMAKAKREGVKMAKLPLDRYLSWGAGSGKSLTLNQMLQILAEVKCSGDWKKALSFVPKRKLITPEEREMAFIRMRSNYEFRRPIKPDKYRT